MPKRPAEVQDLDEEEEEEDYEDRRPRKSPKKNGNDNGRGKGKGKHREGVDDEDSDDEGLGGEDVHGYVLTVEFHRVILFGSHFILARMFIAVALTEPKPSTSFNSIPRRSFNSNSIFERWRLKQEVGRLP